MGVLAGGCIVLALSLCASPASAVVTFGSTLPVPSFGYYDSCSDACTTGLLELPGATVTAPVSGTIVRFRLRTGAGSDPQMIRFRVLRSADGVTFTGAGTSAAFALPTTAGVTEFTVSMPVRKGDYIGIDEPAGDKQAHVVAQNAGAFQAGWFPALADGSASRPSGNAKGSAPTLFDLLLQADIEPTPAPTPTPTPATSAPAPALLNCTNSAFVATCPDPNGSPAMCGPTTAGFPQCSIPLTLPTACSGTGTGFPVCSLPGNHIVACGGFGMSLGVCDIPPLSVPQVCGPTTVGLPPCAAANNQVLACGPTSVGLPACNFKTLIKAPAPIDISSGALDLDVSCPPGAEGAAAGAGAAGTARPSQSQSTCDAEIDLATLVDAKRGRLIGEGSNRCSLSYLGAVETSDEKLSDTMWGNVVSCNYRNRAVVLGYLKSDLHRGYSGESFAPLGKSDALRIRDVMQSQTARFPGLNAAPYQGPIEVWQNSETLRQGRIISEMIVAAVNEIYALQERIKKKTSKASATAPRQALPEVPAASVKPLVGRHFKVRRGTRATRIHLRLPPKAIRELRKRASRRSNAVAVRLVVSFKAKPRPIVRFIDFRLRMNTPPTRKSRTR